MPLFADFLRVVAKGEEVRATALLEVTFNHWRQKMKPIAKTIVCCFAVACFYTVTAGAETTNSTSATEVDVTSTDQATESDSADTSLPAGNDTAVAPDQKVPVIAQPEDVDQAKVEKRLEDKADRTRQRIAEAKKDVAEREDAAKQKQADSAVK